MKYIVRWNDQDAKFYENEIEKAKEYMTLEMPDKEDFIDCDFEKFAETHMEYNREIKAAESLEELAAIWNKYTDVLADGSSFKVREIKACE